jgi:hemolysin III
MSWLDFREPVSAWTHGLWCLLAFPGTVFLWHRGRGNRVRQLGLLFFGLSLAACCAGSTLFHAVRLPHEQIELCGAIDHVGIYLLIAGTVTPVALVILEGRWRWGTLAAAWLLAAGGIVLCLAYVEIPLAWSTGLYLGMGWGAGTCYLLVARVVPHQVLRSAVLGGLFYSVGAILNVLNWPALWPGVFAAHELFHLFVMAGSLAHFWFMLQVVARFEPSTAEAADNLEDVDPGLISSLGVISVTEKGGGWRVEGEG